jgi:hypothetical protein
MKKVLIVVMFITFLCCAAAGKNIGPVKSLKKIELTYQKQNADIKVKINPLTFAIPFCERLAYSTGIYKYISYGDLVKAGISIYSILNSGSAATFKIKDYKDGKDLVFKFYFMSRVKDLMVFCTSNYLESTGEIVGDDKIGESWAMAYYLIGDKLVNYSYITGNDKTPPTGSSIELGNYYMQDADPKNDAMVEQLVLDGIKTDKNPQLTMAYAILSQYYMLVNDLDKAKAALKNVIKAKDDGKGLTKDELYYITGMELDVVTKCYKD